jgi:hypothetical protein
MRAAIPCVLFLAWFSMKFHMDNANDSETMAYMNAMMTSASHSTISVDANGHYTVLAQYVLWSIATTLEQVTGAYQIRGLVFGLLLVDMVLYAAAYAWYRMLGLGWLTSVVGLVVLSTSLAYATQLRGWELDKLIEPALFLLGALAAWKSHWVAVVGLAALAGLNRETGVFFPLVALAGLTQVYGEPLSAALRRRPFWACLIVCAVEVGWLRAIGPTPSARPWVDLGLAKLMLITGGLCLMPVLSLAWLGAAPPALRRLYLLLVPAWIVLVLATDTLEQGALLLTLMALVFVPVTLMGVEQLVQAPREVRRSPG